MFPAANSGQSRVDNGDGLPSVGIAWTMLPGVECRQTAEARIIWLFWVRFSGFVWVFGSPVKDWSDGFSSGNGETVDYLWWLGTSEDASGAPM